MDHVNWWLTGLAFVLGLLLTFALMIRRVKREVPVSSSTGPATAGGTAGDAAESEATKIAAAGAGAAESKTEKSKSESENNDDARGD
jgi:uncharacterized membrane protein ArfC